MPTAWRCKTRFDFPRRSRTIHVFNRLLSDGGRQPGRRATVMIIDTFWWYRAGVKKAVHQGEHGGKFSSGFARTAR